MAGAAETEGLRLTAIAEGVFRMRRAGSKKKWELVIIVAEPRSAFILSGLARYEWGHSIPRMDALRYSITFRSLREGQTVLGQKLL